MGLKIFSANISPLDYYHSFVSKKLFTTTLLFAPTSGSVKYINKLYVVLIHKKLSTAVGKIGTFLWISGMKRGLGYV